jgi:hypothetical protein
MDRRFDGRQRALAVLAALLLLSMAVAQVGVILSEPASDEPERTYRDVKLVRPVENGSGLLWPYTSRQKSFETLTLPINVVVRERVQMVRYVFAAQADAEWQNQSALDNRSEANPVVIRNGTSAVWTTTTGSERYTYVRNESTDRARWSDATYQLHDGDYFGTRYHLRLYEGTGEGGTSWTAIQAHYEYWDWFRLRHTVGNLPRAQRYVESQLFGEWYVDEISRERYANGGVLGADGWVTVVDFDENVTLPPLQFLGPALFGLAVTPWLSRVRSGRRTLRATIEDSGVTPRHVALFAGVLTLPLAVRVAGIAAERAFPSLVPYGIGVVLFPLLVLGLPVVAATLGRGLPADDAFGAGFGGLGAGFLADFAYLGVSEVLLDVLVHRSVLVIALGLVAAGGARWDATGSVRDRVLAVGVALWTWGILGPLLGF